VNHPVPASALEALEALGNWPNPATVLLHAERALEALQRAEEQVEELQELCRPASDDPTQPGPVGSAAVLQHIRKARSVTSGWADIAAAVVGMYRTKSPSRDGGSTQIV